MRAQTRNVVLVGRGKRLLGLHDFNVIGYARAEPVARLDQRFGGKIHICPGHFQLFCGGLQIKQRVSHFIVDPAPHVLRRIFFDQKFEPLHSFDELNGDEKNKIVFFLGSSGIDKVSGLETFVRNGGAVMIV